MGHEPSKEVMREPPGAGPETPAGPGEESAWVARAQRGDERAFSWLVERYRDRAYGLALRIVRSPADAEEVAQDAFVRAWSALPRFRGEARFSTWLYRIVSRLALDRAAQLRTRASRETEIDDPEHLAASLSVPADTDRVEREQSLSLLLSHLTDVQRAVVMLYYLEERSVDEVSRSLDLPQGTVKTHLFRARKVLRNIWQQEFAGRES